MKRILCLWLPQWPIQRLRVARPEFDRCPVVLHAAVQGVDRVMRCSQEAAALGAKPGMPLAEWLAIVGDVGQARPDLQLTRRDVASTEKRRLAALIGTQFCQARSDLPYDATADREALEALAAASEQFSPLVGIEQAEEPECLLLDITGVVHLFGSEQSLAERILANFCRQGYAVRIGIADTVGAAWAAAHYMTTWGRLPTCQKNRQISNLPYMAIIPSGATSEALRGLPIEALRLPDEMIDVLHQLGVERIEQLESLPREEVAARLDPIVLLRIDQAAGRAAESLSASEPPPQIRAEQFIEHPTARRETIEVILERLVGKISRQLVLHGLGAMRVECVLDCRAASVVSGQPQAVETVRLTVGLFEPTATSGHLLPLVRTQFERLKLPGPVSNVVVEATATAPIDPPQKLLFADGPDQPSRQLAAMIDRLCVRLGSQVVLGVRRVADAQPERAWRYEPLATGTRRRRRRSTAADLPPRPVRLLPRPVRLAADTVQPGGALRQFHLDGRRHRIVQHWGPERIETGWWRGRMIGRDYYQVETETGQRYWLFRQRGDGQWFLHGMFD